MDKLFNELLKTKSSLYYQKFGNYIIWKRMVPPTDLILHTWMSSVRLEGNRMRIWKNVTSTLELMKSHILNYASSVSCQIIHW